MTSYNLTTFRSEYVAPVVAKIATLKSEIASAEAEFTTALKALPYNDETASTVEANLSKLQTTLVRWQRRLGYIESRVTAQSGGTVSA